MFSVPLLRIAAHAMDLVRPHLKLNAEQDAAWQIVRGLIDAPPLQ